MCKSQWRSLCWLSYHLGAIREGEGLALNSCFAGLMGSSWSSYNGCFKRNVVVLRGPLQSGMVGKDGA